MTSQRPSVQENNMYPEIFPRYEKHQHRNTGITLILLIQQSYSLYR